MAKQTITIAKDSPVNDALKSLKDEETELLNKLKPVQEAIGALEKIVDKYTGNGKKSKSSSSKKSASDDGESDSDDNDTEETTEEVAEEAQMMADLK